MVILYEFPLGSCDTFSHILRGCLTDTVARMTARVRARASYWTMSCFNYGWNVTPRPRYDTWYGVHDTICSAIHLPFLAGKQRLVIPACDQKHRTPPITTTCAVMMRDGYNNGGLLRVSRCSVFVMNLLVLLEYTGCYLWYLMFVSNFGKCYNCTVSYRIFLGAYRNTYHSLFIGGIPVCRCIISALVSTWIPFQSPWNHTEI